MNVTQEFGSARDLFVDGTMGDELEVKMRLDGGLLALHVKLNLTRIAVSSSFQVNEIRFLLMRQS